MRWKPLRLSLFCIFVLTSVPALLDSRPGKALDLDLTQYTVSTASDLVMHTIDFVLTDELAQKAGESIVITLPEAFANLTRNAVMVQLQYGFLGRAQWEPFPNYHGVYVHLGSISLPVGSWKSGGLQLPVSIRVVAIAPKIR